MKKVFENQLTKDLLVIVFAFALLIFISVKNKDKQFSENGLPEVLASTEDNFSGYAWSDNIGWISFNCTDTNTCVTSNYGVTVDSNNKVSGYAWSDNIGWISFNEEELSGCPIDECKAKLVGGKLTGWARVLANGGGWDGWISLDRKSNESISYGVSLNEDSHFEGFAWGGEVVGWIDFDSAFSEVIFSGSPPSIDIFQVSSVSTGSKPMASFTTRDASRCDLVSDIGYEDLAVCNSENQCADVELLIDKEVTEETTYTLTCYNVIGTSVSQDNTPYKYLELNANPNEVTVDFVSGPATTTPTDIGVISFNGFTDSIIFSADLSNLPESEGEDTTNTAVFSRSSLSFSDYFNGTKTTLVLFASRRFTEEETISVFGNSLYPVVITINAGKIDPAYEEI